MLNFLNLSNHLDNNEKMVLSFKPSRKAYIHHYFLFLIVLIGSIVLLTYFALNITSWFATILFYLSLTLLIYAIIMLLRLEYRIWSRRYAITNEKLLYSKGIFTEKFKSARYSYITDIGLNQSLWDKIMNTGTLTINTAGSDK